VADIGDVVRCTGRFRNAAGDLADPSVILCKIRKPGENVETLTHGVDVALVRASTGVYYTDVLCTEHGTFTYRFSGTGSVQAAGEKSFIVERSQFS